MSGERPFCRLNPLGVINQYLLRGVTGWWLIDAGMKPLHRLLPLMLARHRLTGSDLRGCILTHAHLDHAGAASWLQSRGVKIYLGEAELPHLRDGEPYAYHALSTPLIRYADQALSAPRCNPDVLLNDGDLIDTCFRVLHTPGHTAGHISLHDERNGTVVSGDIILGWSGKIWGPSGLFTPDMPQALESARKLLRLNPTWLLPGHGDPLSARDLVSDPERVIKQFGGMDH